MDVWGPAVTGNIIVHGARLLFICSKHKILTKIQEPIRVITARLFSLITVLSSR
jgi:hypothetical protein